MSILLAFARTVTTANLWIARILHWAVLLLFVLLLWDAVMRYVAGSPISWSQQLSRLLFGVYAILGGGYLLARREHVNVDLFYANFSRKRQALVDILTSFLFFCLLLVLIPKSYGMASEAVCLSENSAPWCKWETDQLAIWKAPLWPSKWMIVVAAVLLFLQGIVKLISDILILCGIDPDPNAFGPIKDGDAETVDV
ncbi:MAG: TRAP transporter small permease subunit [Pseudomonadota bacterium]